MLQGGPCDPGAGPPHGPADRCEGAEPPLRSPMAGLPPRTPGDFLMRRKSPKIHQGAPPGPPRGTLRSPCGGAATPSIGFLPLTQTDLPLWVGGQIGLFSPRTIPGVTPSAVNPGAEEDLVSRCCPELQPFLGGAAKPLWGDDNAPHGGSGGKPPDTPLVTFVVKRKSPWVPSMALPCSRGAPAGGCRGYQPRINSPGHGAKAHTKRLGAQTAQTAHSFPNSLSLYLLYKSLL